MNRVRITAARKLNGLVPEKYIAHLLRQLKGEPTEKEKAALLPCCCAL